MDWEKWLTATLSKSGLPEEVKDEFYTQVVLQMISLAYSHPQEPNVFKAAGVDWDKVNRGGETLKKKYPTSTKIPSRYLRAAMQAKNYDVGRSIVARMNHVFDGMEWWGDEAYEFYQVVKLLTEDAAGQKADPE